MILRIWIIRRETQLCMKLLLRFWPMLPSNVGKSRIEVCLRQGWIGDKRSLQCRNRAGVVADLSPQLADKQERLLGTLIGFKRSQHFGCVLHIPVMYQ